MSKFKYTNKYDFNNCICLKYFKSGTYT